MPLITAETALTRQYDICIVGSGPAGLAAALRLSEAGRAVLVVEAGGLKPTPGPELNLNDPATHLPPEETHCQALGGTTSLWGGRIIPLAPHDLRCADWPLRFEDLARHYDAAAAFLGGSIPDFSFLQAKSNAPFDLNAAEMLADSGSLMRWHRPRIDAPDGPDVLLNTKAVGLLWETHTNGESCCTGLRLRPKGGDPVLDLHVRRVVLAQGGMETMRLLLAEQARHPERLGHLRALGQYYAGHITGSIASIIFPPKTDMRAYGWHRHDDQALRRRVFRSTERAMAEGVNMFFWARNSAPANADHRSGILSAKYLLARLRGKIAPPQALSGPRPTEPMGASSIVAHLCNLFTDAGPSLRALPGVLHARRDPRREMVDHLIPNGANRYRLCYHTEHQSRAANRVTLASPVTAEDLPALHVNFSFSETDVDLVLRGHEMLADALERSGRARLEQDLPPSTRAAAVRDSARDGYHQTGMARMGRDPRDSVVDGDCRVHGVNGLYISGASVFRSSGAPQPTLSITSLSMRLADHLEEQLASFLAGSQAGRCRPPAPSQLQETVAAV